MEISRLRALGAVRPPADATRIAEAADALGRVIPAQLRELYTLTDGFLTPHGTTVYGVADLVERNVTFEVHEYCPDYLLVGDDSGGRGFLIQADSPTSPVFSSDLGDLDVADFAVEGASMSDWVAARQ